MWDERFLRVIPAIVFLFCLLEVFEMVLVINDMNKIEKLEYQLKKNLEVLEKITILLKEPLESTQLEHYKTRNNATTFNRFRV